MHFNKNDLLQFKVEVPFITEESPFLTEKESPEPKPDETRRSKRKLVQSSEAIVSKEDSRDSFHDNGDINGGFSSDSSQGFIPEKLLPVPES